MSPYKLYTTRYSGRYNNTSCLVIDLSIVKDKIIDLFYQGLNNR